MGLHHNSGVQGDDHHAPHPLHCHRPVGCQPGHDRLRRSQPNDAATDPSGPPAVTAPRHQRLHPRLDQPLAGRAGRRPSHGLSQDCRPEPQDHQVRPHPVLRGRRGAQEAAKDHPEASPDEVRQWVPNDFYIRNVNPKLRTLPVPAEAAITVITLAWGEGPADSQRLSRCPSPSSRPTCPRVSDHFDHGAARPGGEARRGVRAVGTSESAAAVAASAAADPATTASPRIVDRSCDLSLRYPSQQDSSSIRSPKGMTIMRPIRTIATALLVASLATAGCGTSQPDQPTTPPSQPPVVTAPPHPRTRIRPRPPAPPPGRASCR